MNGDDSEPDRNAMIQQLNPPLPMDTVRGAGLAHFLIDYGPESHLMWVVFLDADGSCWTVPNPEVRMQRNWSLQRRPTVRPFGAPVGAPVGEPEVEPQPLPEAVPAQDRVPNRVPDRMPAGASPAIPAPAPPILATPSAPNGHGAPNRHAATPRYDAAPAMEA